VPLPLRKRRVAVAATAVTVGLAAFAAFGARPAEATPVRGNTAWSVLMCKFSDQAVEQHGPTWFSQYATPAGNGLGGLSDYWRTVSGGKISLAGSSVHGWYRMNVTLATSRSSGYTRWQRIQDCIAAARSGGYTVPAGNRIMAIINGQVDSGSAGGEVLLDPLAWNVAFAAHEMGHGYGLGHSFSDDPTYRNVSWAQIGEYDNQWDLMSAMNIFTSTSAHFGASPIGLNAFQLDRQGWMPWTRIARVGADGVNSRTYTLAPLGQPGTAGYQLLRVPFNPGNLNDYYTVEYRRKLGVDAAIPADTVLINQVINNTPYLLRTRDGDRHPVQSLNLNGITIRINSATGAQASVTVTTEMPTRCLQGYVWREARAGDAVCVLPAQRSQTWSDNANASQRWVNGPYGPHTCLQGYVWREAFSGDDVCVVPAQRSQAAADNAQAANRRNPARLAYGPNSCKVGYVWREADPSDYVCVVPSTRTQTRNDNAAATSRWVNGPYGPHTCLNGYVWREAFPSDQVCVVPSLRTQAQYDNSQNPNRLATP
jgi:hypothetical protein